MIGRQAQRLASELHALARSATAGTFFGYLASLLLHSGAVIRMQSLRPADAGLAKRMCHFVINGGMLSIPGEHIGLAREIVAKRIYDWAPRFAIKRGDTVVDLGANVGVFSLYAAAQGASVVSVEAQDGFRPLLQDLFRANDLTPTTIVHALVGSASGVFGNAENRLAASHWGSEPRPMTLAQLLETAGLSTVDLLKADIEGSEYDLLLSSDIQTLRRIRRIAMEVHTDHGDAQQLVSHLTGAGFRVFITDGQLRRVPSLRERFGFLYAEQHNKDGDG